MTAEGSLCEESAPDTGIGAWRGAGRPAVPQSERARWHRQELRGTRGVVASEVRTKGVGGVCGGGRDSRALFHFQDAGGGAEGDESRC